MNRDPSLKLSISVRDRRLTVAEFCYTFDMTESHRQAFLDGSWDAAALLASNHGLIEGMDKPLPC